VALAAGAGVALAAGAGVALAAGAGARGMRAVTSSLSIQGTWSVESRDELSSGSIRPPEVAGA
jgi:hypothetical protein